MRVEIFRRLSAILIAAAVGVMLLPADISGADETAVPGSSAASAADPGGGSGSSNEPGAAGSAIDSAVSGGSSPADGQTDSVPDVATGDSAAPQVDGGGAPGSSGTSSDTLAPEPAPTENPANQPPPENTANPADAAAPTDTINTGDDAANPVPDPAQTAPASAAPLGTPAPPYLNLQAFKDSYDTGDPAATVSYTNSSSTNTDDIVVFANGVFYARGEGFTEADVVSNGTTTKYYLSVYHMFPPGRTGITNSAIDLLNYGDSASTDYTGQSINSNAAVDIQWRCTSPAGNVMYYIINASGTKEGWADGNRIDQVNLSDETGRNALYGYQIQTGQSGYIVAQRNSWTGPYMTDNVWDCSKLLTVSPVVQNGAANQCGIKAGKTAGVTQIDYTDNTLGTRAAIVATVYDPVSPAAAGIVTGGVNMGGAAPLAQTFSAADTDDPNGLVAQGSAVTVTGVCGSYLQLSGSRQWISRSDVYIPVTGVTVNPTKLSLYDWKTATLKAAVVPSIANDTTVSWASDYPGIAAVDPNTGQVTTYAGGTATITATTGGTDAGGNHLTAACTVAVTPTTLTVKPSSMLLFGGAPGNTGSAKPLTSVTLEPSGETVNVSLSSNKTGIAKIDKNGRIVAQDTAGTATVTATYTSPVTGLQKTAACVVNVAIPVTAVSLPNTFTVLKGGSAALYPSYTPSNQGGNDLSDWSSKNNGVATANGGVVTGIGEGVTLITHTAKQPNAKDSAGNPPAKASASASTTVSVYTPVTAAGPPYVFTVGTNKPLYAAATAGSGSTPIAKKLTTCKVIGICGDFFYINVNGVTGFVHKNDVMWATVKSAPGTIASSGSGTAVFTLHNVPPNQKLTIKSGSTKVMTVSPGSYTKQSKTRTGPYKDDTMKITVTGKSAGQKKVKIYFTGANPKKLAASCTVSVYQSEGNAPGRVVSGASTWFKNPSAKAAPTGATTKVRKVTVIGTMTVAKVPYCYVKDGSKKYWVKESDLFFVKSTPASNEGSINCYATDTYSVKLMNAKKGSSVTWAAADTSILSIEGGYGYKNDTKMSTCTFRALKDTGGGTTTLTATCKIKDSKGKVVATFPVDFTIKVKPITIEVTKADGSVVGDKLTLYPDDSAVTLKAAASGGGGSFSWSTTNTSSLYFDFNVGKNAKNTATVKPKALTQTTLPSITVTYSGKDAKGNAGKAYSKTIYIEVKERPPVKSVSIDQGSSIKIGILQDGQSHNGSVIPKVKLTATINPPTASGTLKWEVITGASYLKIDKTTGELTPRVVTPVGLDSCVRVTATDANTKKTVTADTYVTVTPGVQNPSGENIDQYVQTITDAWDAYYAKNGAPYGCTTFPLWFFKNYVDTSKLQFGDGDGGDVAYNISKVSGVPLSTTPIVPSVFGARDGAWHCVGTYGGPGYEKYTPSGRGTQGGLIGHTGIVVKIEGNTVYYLSYYSGSLHLDHTEWNKDQTVDFVSLAGCLKNL